MAVLFFFLFLGWSVMSCLKIFHFILCMQELDTRALNYLGKYVCGNYRAILSLWQLFNPSESYVDSTFYIYLLCVLIWYHLAHHAPLSLNWFWSCCSKCHGIWPQQAIFYGSKLNHRIGQCDFLELILFLKLFSMYTISTT